MEFDKIDKEVLKRIIKVVNDKYDGVMAKFCQAMGIKPPSFFSTLKREGDPSYKLLKAIIGKHKEINPYWLMLGEGEMEQVNFSIENQDLKEKLETAEKEIIYLKKINSLLENQK